MRFGVIGCGGHVTTYQLPALKECQQIVLVALADLDETWVRSVARRFRIPEYHTNYRELIGKVDAVLIATPNASHADIACDLLDHGIHVICEKPLATSVAEIERMYECAESSGARLMAAHCFRFSPHFSLLKQIIDEGWIGQITRITAEIGGPYNQGVHRTDFRMEKRLAGGGALLDLGIHLIDLCLWYAGTSPTSIAYQGKSAAGCEIENEADLTLEFSGPIRATLSCSFRQRLDNSFSVEGNKGWARALLYNPTMVELFGCDARVCQRNGFQTLILSDRSMYTEQVNHFCQAVLSESPFRVSPSDVLSGMDIIERSYLSQN